MLRRPCTGVGDGARGGHQQELRAVGLQEKKDNTSEKASPRDDSHDVCHGHVSQGEPAPTTPKRKACQARCHLMSSPLRLRRAPATAHGPRAGARRKTGRSGRSNTAAAGSCGGARGRELQLRTAVILLFYSSTASLAN